MSTPPSMYINNIFFETFYFLTVTLIVFVAALYLDVFLLVILIETFPFLRPFIVSLFFLNVTFAILAFFLESFATESFAF